MSPHPRIMLVDDDPAVRASLHFALDLEGFNVDTFESGEALIDRAEIAAAACLVLDYRLPGMDGLSLLALLRARGIDIPAVIITSAPTRDLCERVGGAAATLVEKPLLGDALTSVIRSLVRLPAQHF